MADSITTRQQLAEIFAAIAATLSAGAQEAASSAPSSAPAAPETAAASSGGAWIAAGADWKTTPAEQWTPEQLEAAAADCGVDLDDSEADEGGGEGGEAA